MRIHSVKSNRIGCVELGTVRSEKKNYISVLTGPNGSGKTEILATITNVFYGAIHLDKNPDTVTWSRQDRIFETDCRNRIENRPRVVAQTFSPFSRFPNILHDNPAYSSPLSGESENSIRYVPVGFASNVKRNISELTYATIEEGLLRLSKEAKVGKAIIKVLHELEFKQGMLLKYQATALLQAMASIAGQKNALEEAIFRSRKSGTLLINGYRPFSIEGTKLFNEAQDGSFGYAADFIRHALQLIAPYQSATVSSANRMYQIRTFEEHTIASDYHVLQAFSLLRQLGLITLQRCMVTPLGRPTIDVRQASSGQQQLLCTFLGLAASLADDAVVLIDEPELSLHPRWQLKCISQIEEILKPFIGCHVIIATHSPLITQAALLHNVEVKELSPLVAFDRSENLGTLSVDEALVTIFDTPVPNSLHVANEILELVSKAESGSDEEIRQATRQIDAYLQVYRSGAENLKIVKLLERAARLITASARRVSEPSDET